MGRWTTGGAVAAAIVAGWACTGQPRVDDATEAAPVPELAWPLWPLDGARLRVLAPFTPPGWRKARLMLDPGHGATGNLGNTSVACRKEADEMLRIATGLLPRLRGPTLTVRTVRPGQGLVDYGARIRLADGWPADALVSLHSDARHGTTYANDPVTGCLRSDGASGFAVLWSDEGAAALVDRRHRLARAVADRMVAAGFAPYGGEDYGAYAADDGHPGVFVDRHAMDQRIRMLRRPLVPSVIVETHQALDVDEVARWQEPRTLDAFASALRQAVVDAVRADGSVGRDQNK